MNKFDLEQTPDPEKVRRFTQCVLRDIRALEHMIAEGLIESGVRRIGAEQELFLVDDACRPAGVAMEVLDELDDDRFATELGRFNLEANLDPLPFEGDCLARLEDGLKATVDRVRAVAGRCGADVVLTGILPTLRQTDLHLGNMTPVPRYRALNAALMGVRGRAFELRLRGTDEISVTHDSVMLEACNTSCQIHLQVGAEEFARLYNIAQAVAAPVLAAATNSPLLFGKRLWHETRIAVFEQSIDTRVPTRHVQEQHARVSFGDRWVRHSVLEIFEDQLARFRTFLGVDVDEDPFEELAAGRMPRLRALSLHNGTVYHWNRPCYGVGGGRPHLRIENRVLPAGPTVTDEVANAAFWLGLMCGFAEQGLDVTDAMSFDTARSNFVSAARQGLESHMTWLDGETWHASDLVLDELLPLAEAGLLGVGVDAGDVERFLGIVERRAATRSTGAAWMLKSYAAMDDVATPFQRLRAIVNGMKRRETEGRPVAEWTEAGLDEAGNQRDNYQRLDQFMTTDIRSVHEDDVIDLVANMMAWYHIRHVPVEDDDHRLVGVVSSGDLLRYIASEMSRGALGPVAVREIMHRDPVSVPPETSTLQAIALMRRERIACLPIVRDGHLVGIVSEHDFVSIAAQLIDEADRPEASGR